MGYRAQFMQCWVTKSGLYAHAGDFLRPLDKHPVTVISCGCELFLPVSGPGCPWPPKQPFPASISGARRELGTGMSLHLPKPHKLLDVPLLLRLQTETHTVSSKGNCKIQVTKDAKGSQQ